MLEGLGRTPLFPHNRHSLDGHGHDHHGEQGNGQAPLQSELVRKDAHPDHQQDDHDQHGGEAGDQQQLELVQVESKGQADPHDHREQRNAPQELRFPKGQGNQDRHERSKGAEPHDVPEDHDEKSPQRDEQQDAVHGLGLNGQPEKGEFEKRRVFEPRTFNGRADRLFLVHGHGQGHLEFLASLHLCQRIGSPPPGQPVFRDSLPVRGKTVGPPFPSIVDLQPVVQRRVPVVRFEKNPVHRSGGHPGLGQDANGGLHPFVRLRVPAQQDTDVLFRVFPTESLQEFGHEAVQIGGLLSDFQNQRFRRLQYGTLEFRIGDLRLSSRLRPLLCFDAPDHGAVVEPLAAPRLARRPGGLTVCPPFSGAQTVPAGDEALIHDGELGCASGQEQADFRRLALCRKGYAGLHLPDRLFRLRSNGKPKDQGFVKEQAQARNGEAQAQHVQVQPAQGIGAPTQAGSDVYFSSGSTMMWPRMKLLPINNG